MNPYFHSEKNPQYPDHHPVNTFIERSSGFIPGDSWDSSLAIDVLFRSDLLTNFIRDALETEAVHCYADPLAGLTANILDPGQQFAWHFDTNEFAVTAMIDEADDGGLFQYVPMIRNPDDEAFENIQRVLDGNLENVKTLELRAGDLQIFRAATHYIALLECQKIQDHVMLQFLPIRLNLVLLAGLNELNSYLVEYCPRMNKPSGAVCEPTN